MHSQDMDRIAIRTGKGHRPGRVTPPIDVVVGTKRAICAVLALPNVDNGGTNRPRLFERRLAPVAIGCHLCKDGPRLGGGWLGVGGGGSACQKKCDHGQTIAAHQEDRKCRQ